MNTKQEAKQEARPDEKPKHYTLEVQNSKLGVTSKEKPNGQVS